MQRITGNVYLSKRTVAIEGENSLIIVDPGYDAAVSKTKKGTSVEELTELSRIRGKPIEYIILTHSHSDHTANLPFYVMLRPRAVIGHYRNRCGPGWKINRTTTQKLDGVELELIPTPGHSSAGDDISVYLPQKKILLPGDLCQPQGEDYRNADNVSPVPFFSDGNRYLHSLEALLAKDFHLMITAHGDIYDAHRGRKALEVTRQTVTRIRDLATKLKRENPDETLDKIALWVYDTIAYERSFDPEALEARKKGNKHGNDFTRYDKPGIDSFLKQQSISRL
ncbi:MBL fold metallo-hydrolase [Candidatus Woesearchaeota archaeon]|nr:MBL fold metallo-hydrolase [Candidatus Woesearchaeota archaeon]